MSAVIRQPGHDRSLSLVDLSLAHPKRILWVIAMVAMIFFAVFPLAKIDTNPKNMLPPTADVRVSNDEVEKRFGLHEDTVVVAVSPAQGVLTQQSLQKLRALNGAILAIDGVVERDVISLFTTDNITSSEDSLRIRPLVPANLDKPEAIQQLRTELFDGTLFMDRLISRDEKTTAFYVPLVKGADGAAVAERIRELARRQFSEQELAITGDPVARDRFGGEMFKLMAIFAPMAGMLMMALIYWMFRSWWLAGVVMMTAMVAIGVSLGAAIALGYPVHIMSSMAPVFLMAIATDGIHIFNEFFLRFKAGSDRATVIRETMAAVARPVRYTLLATAAGFGVLLFMSIVPVKVFGAIIVAGTVVLRILSFTLMPAALMLIPLSPKAIQAATSAGPSNTLADRWLSALASGSIRHHKTLTFGAVVLLGISVWGMSHIVVNNNMLHWFKPGSDLRQADVLISEQLGGSAPAYLVVDTGTPDGVKDPLVLGAMDRLQTELKSKGLVGNTLSVADYVKRINRVLHGDHPDQEVLPQDEASVGQYLLAFSMSAKPSDLNRVVDYPFERANIILQLRSWDAQAMRRVADYVEAFSQREKLSFTIRPAGSAYFNLVWNQEVLKDMIVGFGLALVVVFAILALDFRSLKWATVAYIPLLLTVGTVFGVIGFVGKDFDMPVAVLSCLSLGMAVDFAIHFVTRLRQRLDASTQHDVNKRMDEALTWVITWPGKGVIRNAALFAVAFSVMVLAPLTPYMTVGLFIVSMMVLSSMATLSLLPALIKTFKLK